MRVVGVALATMSLAASPALAKPLPRYGVFVFSDLCEDYLYSGDVGGSRLTLTRTKTGDTLGYEYGNGPLQTAAIRTFGVQGDKLTATANASDGELKLSAALADDAIVLTEQFAFEESDNLQPKRLLRLRRIPAKMPACPLR